MYLPFTSIFLPSAKVSLFAKFPFRSYLFTLFSAKNLLVCAFSCCDNCCNCCLVALLSTTCILFLIPNAFTWMRPLSYVYRILVSIFVSVQSPLSIWLLVKAFFTSTIFPLSFAKIFSLLPIHFSNSALWFPLCSSL